MAGFFLACSLVKLMTTTQSAGKEASDLMFFIMPVLMMVGLIAVVSAIVVRLLTARFADGYAPLLAGCLTTATFLGLLYLAR